MENKTIKQYTVHFNAQFGRDVNVVAENEEEAIQLARERVKNSDHNKWEFLMENDVDIVDVNIYD